MCNIVIKGRSVGKNKRKTEGKTRENKQEKREKMRKGKRIASKVITGALAAVMTLVSSVTPFGSGPETVYADAYDNIYPTVKINSTTFPDPNFRAVVSADFDTNKNGSLESSEIVYARNLWCVNKGIKSLKGIEYLKELRGIYCMDNQISSWDLSQNKLLTGIWCSGNKFTSLDFTVNPVLEWVYAFDCQLTSFNVRNNPEISYLELNSNPLGSIDVSRNKKLEHLMVGDCGLTTLDVTHNPNLQHLDAFRNKFQSLDLSHNPKMKRLDVWDNPGLGDVDTSNMPGLQYYNCAKNQCKSVDVSKNPELQKLVVSYNRGYLKSLDISHNPKLTILQIQDNELKSLDISHNPMLRFIWGGYNDFTELNIGNNPYLMKIYNEGTWADEGWNSSSWTIDYGGDDSTQNDNLFILWLDNDVKIVNKPSGDPFAALYPEEPNGDLSNFITREAMVQTLYEMAGKPSVSGLKTRFDDVEYGQWYTDALLWGEKNSICVGYPYTSADTFGLGICLNRQDLMLMLMRYTEYIGYDRAIDFGRSDDFLDYFDVDYDHWEAVCWAATHRILEGRGEPGAPKEERMIAPLEKATRAEILQMINYMYEANHVNKTAKLANAPAPVPIPVKILDASVKYPTLSQDGQQTFTVKTSTNAQYLMIYGESGNLVKRYPAYGNSVVSGGSRIWTVSMNIASAGNRSLVIKAGKSTTPDDVSKTVKFTVVGKNIQSAKAKEASIAKDSTQTFTVVTSGDVKYLSLYSEDGKTLVKTWAASGNSTVSADNFRTWTISKAMASAGARKLIFKGGTTDSIPVTNAVTVSFNVVDKGVVSAAAKYSAITKGSVQGFTVQTTADAQYLMLYSEDGKTLVKTWAASGNSTVSGNTRTWSVMQTIGTAGSRKLVFKSGITTTPSGVTKTVSFNVVTSGVLTASTKYPAITKGTEQTFTVTTTADAKYLTLYSEDGKTFVASWTASSANSKVSGNTRTWTVSQKISTTGDRNLIFKAGSTSTPTAGMRASAFKVVDTGVISASAKYASIYSGNQQTFTVKTTADCKYLVEYAEDGKTVVKTWTASSSNSTVSGNVRTWTVKQAINTTGNRNLIFKAGSTATPTAAQRSAGFTVK